jgi:hypothetical protein
MRTRRILLAGTAALALLGATPAPARAGLLDFGGLGDLFGGLHGSGGIIQVLEAIFAAIFPVDTPLPQPPTVDGSVLAGTQQPIGQGGDSYITGSVPSANPLFPPEGNPEWLPPDGLSTYSAMRLQDRSARVDEAEAHATAVTTDDLAAPARLDGFVTTNGLATDLLTVGKTGTTVAIETAGQLHKLTSLQAEANQIEADKAMQEDWARKQADLMNHAVFGNGYWTGVRKWQPDVQANAGY